MLECTSGDAALEGLPIVAQGMHIWVYRRGREPQACLAVPTRCHYGKPGYTTVNLEDSCTFWQWFYLGDIGMLVIRK